MIACLLNTVSVKDLCPNAVNLPSSSGYDIWQAPEIKYKGIAAITDEKYIRGRNLLLAARDMALLEVQGDFLKIITANGYSITSGTSFYQAAVLDNSIINPVAPVERGLTIHTAKPSLIRKLLIKEVHVYPVQSLATAQLKIWDNGAIHIYPVQLTGGQINTFTIDYRSSGDYVRIYLDNSTLETYSSAISCMVGCNGSMPNECGYVTGWNGTGQVKSEGFGISATFACECDYSQLLCSWSKQFIGEIIWWKMRAIVQEEVLNSDRLNNFTIWNREEAKKKHIEFENTYREKWNAFAEALPGLMKNLRDDCIICNRTSWKTNV